MTTARDADLPVVTVVMPVRDEAAALAESLGTVLAQDYPRDRLEVIVADGRSTDGTRALVEELRAGHPGLVLIDNPQRLAASGLNHALRVACGDVLVRVDGHTRIAPDYVRACVEELRRSGADNVGGRMVAVGRTPFGEAVAAATSSRFGVGGALFHYLEREAWVDTVYLGAWPRATLERIGLFDEEQVRNQDDEHNYRLRAADGRILLSPRIRSTYTCRSTPRSLWRQYFQYGLWKVRVLQKHPRQMRPRQFVPPLFVFTLGLAVAAVPLSSWPSLLLVVSYGTANLAASLVTAARAGWRHLPRLPAVFATLHLAYGSGFLIGLAVFAGRWRARHGRVPELAPRKVAE